MTLAQTYAWIFYATGIACNKNTATLKEIEAVADGINHAIPTQKELQESIKWLESKGLIVTSGKKISLTSNGTRLLATVTSKPGGTFKVWERIEKKFAELGVDNTNQLNPRNFDVEEERSL